MTQQRQWQVAGSAPEVYERELVPAIFAPWAPIVIDLANPKEGDHVLDAHAERASSRGWSPIVWALPVK